jgi:hypothetical protein
MVLQPHFKECRIALDKSRIKLYCLDYSLFGLRFEINSHSRMLGVQLTNTKYKKLTREITEGVIFGRVVRFIK